MRGGATEWSKRLTIVIGWGAGGVHWSRYFGGACDQYFLDALQRVALVRDSCPGPLEGTVFT